MSSQMLQVTPHIVGLIALCTGTRTQCLSRSVNSFTFNVYETFTRAVSNSLKRSTQRESNLVITRLTWEPCLPFSWEPAETQPVIWDASPRPAESAGITPPSITFMNPNVRALPEWHSQPLPTTDSTTGSLSRIVTMRSSCNWACQCLAPKAVTLSRWWQD